MTNEEMLREIGALPPEGQRLVESFVDFLRQRYPQPATTASDAAWQGEPFIGMWGDRDEMTDSSAWVRGVRESEWEK